ncbi:hypothetical protein [Shigella boydii]|uniref:hypothetical protein n=1 Tax=Shigella boydii TaxID=621 RepID=UPI00287A9ACF|nr:hypothetical protein [Shigella boydii]MDS1445764.1 hypothetical protein [Shigella boydii]MDS1447616.1 hypothetical protein [Shigella boydii]MDS1482000.1 hypothetical protein [Shigella boydii]MDS1486862.1 hypothetical protein [Shigella boydii]
MDWQKCSGIKRSYLAPQKEIIRNISPFVIFLKMQRERVNVKLTSGIVHINPIISVVQ